MIRFLWGRIPVGLEDDEWTAPDRSSRGGGDSFLHSLIDDPLHRMLHILLLDYTESGGGGGYCPGFLIQLTKYSFSRHLFLHMGFIYEKGCGRWIHE
jgi:hypothetical protein